MSSSGLDMNPERRMRGALARKATAALIILFAFQMESLSLIHHKEPALGSSREWAFYAPYGESIPAAFVHTKELHDARQTLANDTSIIMDPQVYANLTKRIRRVKRARKPLVIMVNSHPCAGKTSFIFKTDYKYFMGCNLLDWEWLKPAQQDGSYLIQDPTANNTAIFRDMRWLSKRERNEDIIYIYVTPPLALMEQYIKKRQIEPGRKTKWSQYERVMRSRKLFLLQIVKDGVVVEPLFPSFQEGLEFCINTYNTEDE